GTKSIAGNQIFITPLRQRWIELHAASLQVAQEWTTKHLDWLWQYVAEPVLNQPAWLLPGLVGAILILLRPKEKAPIGYGRDRSRLRDSSLTIARREAAQSGVRGSPRATILRVETVKEIADMFMFRKKTDMPSAADALPGRASPIPTARDHFINHHPL